MGVIELPLIFRRAEGGVCSFIPEQTNFPTHVSDRIWPLGRNITAVVTGKSKQMLLYFSCEFMGKIGVSLRIYSSNIWPGAKGEGKDKWLLNKRKFGYDDGTFVIIFLPREWGKRVYTIAFLSNTSRTFTKSVVNRRLPRTNLKRGERMFSRLKQWSFP